MRIRISSIPHSITKDQIRDLFEEFGEVDTIKIFRDLKPGGSNCLCFVEMPIEREAIEAIDEMDGYRIENNRMKVEPSQDIFVRKSPVPVKPVFDDEDEDEDDELLDEIDDDLEDSDDLDDLNEIADEADEADEDEDDY